MTEKMFNIIYWIFTGVLILTLAFLITMSLISSSSGSIYDNLLCSFVLVMMGDGFLILVFYTLWSFITKEFDWKEEIIKTKIRVCRICNKGYKSETKGDRICPSCMSEIE